MQFSYYGHACFQININDTKFLCDPFILSNPKAKGVNTDNIQADYILVSHGHEDHIADILVLANQTQATVISCPEVLGWVKNQGYSKVEAMNFGTKTMDFGTLHYFQAQHSSSMPDGSYGGNPGGFIIQSDNETIYYSGDTGLFLDLQLVPKIAQAAINTAILPIGGTYTMNAQEAIWANDYIKATNIIGVHFNTFKEIEIDEAATKKQFQQAGISFILPEIGSVYNV